MPQVRFYELDDKAEPRQLGAIMLRNGKLVAESTELIVTRLLDEPLITYEGKDRISIDPENEPERFLNALPRAIRGCYFWAGKVEE